MTEYHPHPTVLETEANNLPKSTVASQSQQWAWNPGILTVSLWLFQAHYPCLPFAPCLSLIQL